MNRKQSYSSRATQRGIVTAELLVWLLVLLSGLWQASASLGHSSATSSSAVLPQPSPTPPPFGGGGSGGGSTGSGSGGGSGSMSVTPEAPSLLQFLPGLLPLGFLLARRKRPKA